MKTVKIKFVDCVPAGIDQENHFVTKALKKRYNVVFSNDPEFLFYDTWGTEFTNYPNAVKVFLGGEPIAPNFNDCDYAFGFVPIEYNGRYFQYPVGEGDENGLYDILSSVQIRKDIDESLFDRKFCNFVASQDWLGYGAKYRKEFCQIIMEKYKHVDCPGYVLHNLDGALAPRWSKGLANGQGDIVTTWAQDKVEFLKKYKFTLAFENCSVSGFTTEKLIQPFAAYSIPIYWGNPDVAKIANPKAFINCHDYNSVDEVIERIRELDNNKNLYLDMLYEKPLRDDFDFNRKLKAEEFLYSIIERGNKQFDKDSMGIAQSTIAYETLKGKSIAEPFVLACRRGEVSLKYILRSALAYTKSKIIK